MLDQLKKLSLATPSVEELISMSAFAKILRAEFEANSVDVPEWLDTKTRELKREIRTRMEEAHARRASEIKARIEALATPAEKKAALQAELDKLEGRVPATV